MIKKRNEARTGESEDTTLIKAYVDGEQSHQGEELYQHLTQLMAEKFSENLIGDLEMTPEEAREFSKKQTKSIK